MKTETTKLGCRNKTPFNFVLHRRKGENGKKVKVSELSQTVGKTVCTLLTGVQGA